jgi:hypothetical protein
MPDRRQFIRDHAVSWEIAPQRELWGGRLRHAGVELRLHARCSRLDPASAEAREAHTTLQEILRDVAPENACLRIEPYDATMRLRRETGWAAEVDLRAEIRRPTLEQVSEAEHETARAVRASLRKLGVPEGVYRSPCSEPEARECPPRSAHLDPLRAVTH